MDNGADIKELDSTVRSKNVCGRGHSRIVPDPLQGVERAARPLTIKGCELVVRQSDHSRARAKDRASA